MSTGEEVMIEGLTEAIKMVIKQQISGTVSSKAEALTKELQKVINDAADAVASRVMDEAKIEEIAKAAREGATYSAVDRLISELGNYAIEQASPLVKEVLDRFSHMMFEAMRRAVHEIVREEVQSRIKELK